MYDLGNAFIRYNEYKNFEDKEYLAFLSALKAYLNIPLVFTKSPTKIFVSKAFEINVSPIFHP